MKVELTKSEPQVTITMSMEQAVMLKALVNCDIDDLSYRGGTEINLPENANMELAYPLWKQLSEIISN